MKTLIEKWRKEAMRYSQDRSSACYSPAVIAETLIECAYQLELELNKQANPVNELIPIIPGLSGK